MYEFWEEWNWADEDAVERRVALAKAIQMEKERDAGDREPAPVK